jgi:hypothetical protein
MSVTIIIGNTGNGKTYSIKTLPEEETIVIACSPVFKGMSFAGGNKRFSVEKKNLVVALTSIDAIATVKALKTAMDKGIKKKYLIIDDSQFLMFNEYMKRAKETTFNKFVDIQSGFYNLILELNKLNIHCFLLHHTEELILDGVKGVKMKTLGKLLDEKVTMEGMFNEILLAKVFRDDEKTQYLFMTQSDGSSSTKSREGMFKELYIPNDLLLVANAIEEYEK